MKIESKSRVGQLTDAEITSIAMGLAESLNGHTIGQAFSILDEAKRMLQCGHVVDTAAPMFNLLKADHGIDIGDWVVLKSDEQQIEIVGKTQKGDYLCVVTSGARQSDIDQLRRLVGLPLLAVWERSCSLDSTVIHFGEKIEVDSPLLRAAGRTFHGTHKLIVEEAVLGVRGLLEPNGCVKDVTVEPGLGYALAIHLTDGQSFSVTPILDPDNGTKAVHWELAMPHGRLKSACLKLSWAPRSQPVCSKT